MSKKLNFMDVKTISRTICPVWLLKGKHKHSYIQLTFFLFQCNVMTFLYKLNGKGPSIEVILLQSFLCQKTSVIAIDCSTALGPLTLCGSWSYNYQLYKHDDNGYRYSKHSGKIGFVRRRHVKNILQICGNQVYLQRTCASTKVKH